MEAEKRKRNQINFELCPELHQQVKIWAMRRNITVANWMKRAVIERLQKETRENPNGK